MRQTKKNRFPVSFNKKLLQRDFIFYPPASKTSREVANLTERKNLHAPFMVSKNLSVCLWSTLTQIISGLAEQNFFLRLAFIDHYTHLYEIVRHQLSYLVASDGLYYL